MEKVEQIKNRIEAILKYKYNYDYNTVNSIMNNIELLGGFEPKFLSVVEEKAIKIMEITGQQDTFYENVLLVITQQKFFNGLNKDRKAINTNILNSENIGKVLDNIIKMSDFIKAKPLNNCPDKVAIFGSDGKIMELEILYFINEIKRLNIKNKPILATILTGDRKIFTNDLTNELIFSATDYNEILKLNKLTIEQRVYVEYCKNINKNFDEFKRDFLNATEYNVACILIENLKKDRKIPHNIDLRVFYANKKELNQSHTTTEDTVKEFLKLHPNCKTFVSTQPFADRQKKNAEIAKKKLILEIKDEEEKKGKELINKRLNNSYRNIVEKRNYTTRIIRENWEQTLENINNRKVKIKTKNKAQRVKIEKQIEREEKEKFLKFKREEEEKAEKFIKEENNRANLYIRNVENQTRENIIVRTKELEKGKIDVIASPAISTLSANMGKCKPNKKDNDIKLIKKKIIPYNLKILAAQTVNESIANSIFAEEVESRYSKGTVEDIQNIILEEQIKNAIIFKEPKEVLDSKKKEILELLSSFKVKKNIFDTAGRRIVKEIIYLNKEYKNMGHEKLLHHTFVLLYDISKKLQNNKTFDCAEEKIFNALNEIKSIENQMNNHSFNSLH